VTELKGTAFNTVTRSVSGEMVLEKLIDRLMRAAIEHAGAERGGYLPFDLSYSAT
jgi:hypothetical protein